MKLPVPVGHVVANKYRVDRLIGAGGMGVVAAGFHLELEQPVAIKFLNMDNGVQIDAAERFRREARAAAKIHSEHVVRVFDIGMLDGQVPYMVMELLEGNDLEQEVEMRGPLPLGEAVEYVLQAIDAIAEAHAVGIVHRDLKPTNLFLARRADGTRSIKVLDFGISKLIASSRVADVALTRTAAMVGSPLYMSPEQMRSAKDVDARTDVWSLGTILYVLVTGSLPYMGASLPELCVAVLSERPRPVKQFLPTIPDAFEALLSRCLAKDRAERFSSVAELAQHLVPFAPAFRVYADRAHRLLGSQSTIESPAPGWSGGVASDAVTRPSSSPSSPERRESRTPPTGATQASWDSTVRSAISRRRVPILVAALVAMLGVAAIVLRQVAFKHEQPAGRVPSVALEAATPPSTEAAAAQTLKVERPAEPEPARSAEVARVEPVPPSNDTNTDKAGPDPGAAAEKKPTAPAQKAAPRPVERPESRPEKARPQQPTPAANVTDFGGRR